MKRSSVNFSLDSLILLLMAAVISTGLVMEFVLPPGSGRLDSLEQGLGGGERSITVLWGLGRHDWGAIHFWLSMSLIAAAVLHLALHWRWIASMITRPRPDLSVTERRRRVGVAMAGVAMVVGILAAPWLGSVERIPRATPDPTNEAGAASEEIRGSMTLREVCERAEISAEALLEELNLPGSTDPASRLGPLRRQHGFEMQDVREAVARLRGD